MENSCLTCLPNDLHKTITFFFLSITIVFTTEFYLIEPSEKCQFYCDKFIYLFL